jgi:hypothetical protein
VAVDGLGADGALPDGAGVDGVTVPVQAVTAARRRRAIAVARTGI